VHDLARAVTVPPSLSTDIRPSSTIITSSTAICSSMRWSGP
jgi:hypothetical protein